MRTEWLRRAERIARARLIYQLDLLLSYPPLVQVGALFVLTAVLVAVFGWLAAIQGYKTNGLEALWWSVTRFMDGGTMAGDERGRLLSLAVTGAGILMISLLTAALSSKMGERIGDMRSGLNPVVERNHVLCLGFDPTVGLVAREIARSLQRCTLVVLSSEDKDAVEAALRPASHVPGHKLRTVVRHGDPRSEHALLRVAAHRARTVIVVPPASLSDDDGVQWTLSTLLAMRRVAEEGFMGQVIVEARHTEARELLSLAGEPGVAGEGQLAMDVVASDEVVAGILAQSTRQAGLYFVLRHLLAFDGCELYRVPVPKDLVGKRFEDVHAEITDAIVVGMSTANGQTRLCPRGGDSEPLSATDKLLLVSAGKRCWRTGGTLPGPNLPNEEAVPLSPPQHVAVVGFNRTLPHLLRELDLSLPSGSRVQLVPGDASEPARAVAEHVQERLKNVRLECDPRPAAQRTHRGQHEMCRADAVVILGNEDPHDENGDASALAMLLRLRHGMKVSGNTAKRVVTEVRDPRSAMHIVPRPGDCVVSSDVVAMLLAQFVTDPEMGAVYQELLSPHGASVSLRPRARHLPPGPATFGQAMANARARGEIALGLFPDPRAHGHEREIARQRLAEGDVAGSEDVWLNPPRDTPVLDAPETQLVVLSWAR